jgi:hypothetical protein
VLEEDANILVILDDQDFAADDGQRYGSLIAR